MWLELGSACLLNHQDGSKSINNCTCGCCGYSYIPCYCSCSSLCCCCYFNNQERIEALGFFPCDLAAFTSVCFVCKLFCFCLLAVGPETILLRFVFTQKSWSNKGIHSIAAIPIRIDAASSRVAALDISTDIDTNSAELYRISVQTKTRQCRSNSTTAATRYLIIDFTIGKVPSLQMQRQ